MRKSISTIPYSILASTALLFAQSSVAQSNDADSKIEEVEVLGKLSVFGATKSNTPILETARSVSIETIDDYLEKGALNLSQTTTYMAGVSSETFGFATRGDWIRIRGLEAPRYRDSIQELFGSYNTTRTEVYTLEQVEILKGPASVLYGQGSAGGLVNAVSKKPKEEAAHELFAQAGTFDRKQLGVDLNSPLSKDGKVLGRFVGVYRDSGTQVEHVDDNTLVLMPSLTLNPTEDTSLTFIGLYQNTESDTGSQFIPAEGTLFPLEDGSYIDQDVYAGEPGFNKFDTKATQLTMLAEHSISDHFMLSGTALWREGEADYHQAWPTFTGDGASRYLNNVLVDFGLIPDGVDTGFTDTTVARSFFQADNTFDQKALDLRLSGVTNTGDIEHELLIGIQYQDVETDNNSSYYYGGGILEGDFSYVLDLANPVYTGAPDQAIFDAIYNDGDLEKVEDIGVYVSDQISVHNVRITLGARFDEVDSDIGQIQQKESAISLSGGVLYQFESGLSPYASYSESFETVIGRLLLSDGIPKPEEGEQIEFGLKYEPTQFQGFFTLAYFDIDISNVRDPNSLQTAIVQFEGTSKLSGLEFESKFELGSVDVQLAYSTLEAEDPEGFSLDTPDRAGSAWLTWHAEDVLPGLSVGAGVRHVGGSTSETESLKYVTPSYTLGDLLFGYDISDDFSLALNVRNVEDKEYLTSCLTRGDCFPGLRRSVNGTATYRF